MTPVERARSQPDRWRRRKAVDDWSRECRRKPGVIPALGRMWVALEPVNINAAAILRESVSVFRHPETTEAERAEITEWWASLRIPNQFAAMLAAADIEVEV